jgi:hypothetical protein
MTDPSASDGDTFAGDCAFGCLLPLLLVIPPLWPFAAIWLFHIFSQMTPPDANRR